MTSPSDLSALLGGVPLAPLGPPPWPVASPHVRAALQAAIDSGTWGLYHGESVERLEARLADMHQVAQAWTCASGTFAVEACMRALGVGPGTEVILAAYDYEPSFLTIHHLGARPVLVDVCSDSPVIDPLRIDEAITSNTRAILATHLHGGLVDMRAVRAIADQRRVPVIEDAAQACGATVEGKLAGSWSDLGVLSFGGSKLLSAGRGGAILASTAVLAQRARLALMRGVQAVAPMSELQATALLPQLDELNNLTQRRADAVATIGERLADVPGIQTVPSPDNRSRAAYYKLGLYLDEAAFGIDRALFCKAMRAEGVAIDPGLRGLHVGRSPSRFSAVGTLDHARRTGEQMVTLHHPILAEGNSGGELVAAAILKTYRNAARLRAMSA